MKRSLSICGGRSNMLLLSIPVILFYFTSTNYYGLIGSIQKYYAFLFVWVFWPGAPLSFSGFFNQLKFTTHTTRKTLHSETLSPFHEVLQLYRQCYNLIHFNLENSSTTLLLRRNLSKFRRSLIDFKINTFESATMNSSLGEQWTWSTKLRF